MNLLPKTFKEFKEKEYWDKFFTRRKKEAFEWYGDYVQLCPILHKYMHKNDNILVVGCGNSQLSADLYDVGLQKITNIDISNVVIKQMVKKHGKQRVVMKWTQMDATQMGFDDGQFSVVLDKGTVDALLTDSGEQVVQQVERMFEEIERVLKIGGRFICISLLQEHILTRLLGWFSNSGWMIRVCRRFDGDDYGGECSTSRMEFPVFAIVCTKLRKSAGMEPVLEAALNSETPNRSNIVEIKETVQALQQFAFLRYHLSKSTLANDDVSFDLFIEGNSAPRYSLHVVDRAKEDSGKMFSIFIVPQGRETEWLFGSFVGRQQLAESAGFFRLVVVHLNRNHQYANLDAIKAELSTRVMELAPPGLSRRSQVPFLSVGDSLGTRNVVYEGTSALSGDFIVEDVIVGEDRPQTYRRLVFLNNPNVIQSEARMVALDELPLSKTSDKSAGIKKKKKKKRKERKQLVVDPRFLACQHHSFMIAGQAFLGKDSGAPCKHLIVGLGGGGLPTFLHRSFSNASVDVVELDPSMVRLSQEFFGFLADDRMRVIVADGLQHIRQTKSESYDMVMFDVDSKDTSKGMSCPPLEFVETETLEVVKNILTDRGVFVLNLVCRDSKLREEVVSAVSGVFPCWYSSKIEDEVNEIVFGLKNANTVSNDESTALVLREKLKRINDIVKSSTRDGEELVEVEIMMKALNCVC